MKLTMTVLGLIINTQFLAACNFEAQNSSPALPAPTNKNAPQGTGDGGGGNLINGRMIESYIINPNDLAPAQRYVLPLLKKILPQTKEDLNKKGDLNHLAIKTWYLGEFDLKNIPKKVLGVEMASNQVDQVAFQTEDAIWIDSRLFNKMTDAEQARLVMHEFNMAFYLLRFESMQTVCKYAQRIGGGCDEGLSPADIKFIESTYQPLPRRDLNSSDYNIIRETTQWLFQQGEAVTEAQWKKFIKQNGFADPRFNSQDTDSTSDGVAEKPVEITGAELKAALLSFDWTKSLKKICYLGYRQESIPCEIKLEIKEVPKSITSNGYTHNYSQSEIFLTAKNSLSGDILQVSPLFMPRDTDKVQFNSIHLGNKNTKISWSAISLSIGISKNQGDFGHLVEFYFDNNRSLNVKEIHLSPYVVAGVSNSEKEENGTKYKCTKAVIKPVQGTTIQDDIVLIGEVDTQQALWMLKSRRFDFGESCSLVQ